MTSVDILETLTKLGDYRGQLGAPLSVGTAKAAIKRFQGATGLDADGIVGPKTTAKLDHYRAALALAPPGFQAARQWRFTRYYVAEERGYAAGSVPVLSPAGAVLARVSAAFFAKVSLEGSGVLKDGRLINVAGGWVPVTPSDFAGVVRIAEANDWLPRKGGYAGIRARETDAGWVATHALNFHVVAGKDKGLGYGTVHGIPCEPFRTAATDCGVHRSADPAYKTHGGVIPRGTRFWVLEFAGATLPSGAVHDGWWTANDSGGGIEGNQCDLFVGTSTISKSMVPWPVSSGFGYLWHAGIEARIPQGYAFGS